MAKAKKGSFDYLEENIENEDVLNEYDKEFDDKNRSRRWLGTINNPKEDYDELTNLIKSLNPKYYCFCKEIGDKGKTPHYHLYLEFDNAKSFKRIKAVFPKAHFEKKVKGTPMQIRQYLRKEGTHADKKHTQIKDSFHEEGKIQLYATDKYLSTMGAKNEDDVDVEVKPNMNSWVFRLFDEGYSDKEILVMTGISANRLNGLSDIYYQDRANMIRDEMNVFYISGPSGVAKTTTLYEEHNLKDICVISNYGNGLFDGYKSQKVLALDEFKSQIPISSLLTMCSPFPYSLPARYYNRPALYTTVYLVSNTNLYEQYPNIQSRDSETFCAFLRRINKVRIFYAFKKYKEYSIREYLIENKEKFHPNIFETEWMRINIPELYTGIRHIESL